MIPLYANKLNLQEVMLGFVCVMIVPYWEVFKVELFHCFSEFA